MPAEIYEALTNSPLRDSGEQSLKDQILDYVRDISFSGYGIDEMPEHEFAYVIFSDHALLNRFIPDGGDRNRVLTIVRTARELMRSLVAAEGNQHDPERRLVETIVNCNPL
jgi:hypothetical protein